MAVQADKGATENVEAVYHREYAVSLEYSQRKMKMFLALIL